MNLARQPIRILFGLLFLSALAAAAQGPARFTSGQPMAALVLIKTSNTGPPVDPNLDPRVDTVVWPPSLTLCGSNRLLSLMTGLDWKGDDYDLSFSPNDEGAPPERQSFEARNFAALSGRGYFTARERYLGRLNVSAVSRPQGPPASSPVSLLLALDQGNHIRPVPFGKFGGRAGLLVFEAESWEEQNEVSAGVQGRTLVLELPEAHAINGPYVNPEEVIGHVYFRGLGWPRGYPVDPSTGIPGLIRARSAVKLLLQPESFEWVSQPASHDTPTLWFAHVRAMTPILLFTFSLVIVYVLGSAVYCIIVEHRGRLAAWVMTGIALAPADLLLSGWLDRVFGIEPWFGFFVVTATILGSLAAVLQQFFTRAFPEAHRLLGVAVVGLGASLLGDPNWSAFSSVFTASGNRTSPEAIGAATAYLCAVVAFAQPTKPERSLAGAPAQWFARAVALGVALLVALGSVWLSGDDWTYRTFPLLAWLIGERLFAPPLLLGWALLPHGPNPYGGSSDVWRHGVVSAPFGCVPTLDGAKALNLSRYLDFLLNPGAMLFGLTAGTVLVLTDRFFVRQLRLLFFQDGRIAALPWLTAALAAAGALNPVILPAAVIAGFGAILSVFYAAVWTI
jgi:hypothetical protein